MEREGRVLKTPKRDYLLRGGARSIQDLIETLSALSTRERESLRCNIQYEIWVDKPRYTPGSTLEIGGSHQYAALFEAQSPPASIHLYTQPEADDLWTEADVRETRLEEIKRGYLHEYTASDIDTLLGVIDELRKQQSAANPSSEPK